MVGSVPGVYLSFATHACFFRSKFPIILLSSIRLQYRASQYSSQFALPLDADIVSIPISTLYPRAHSMEPRKKVLVGDESTKMVQERGLQFCGMMALFFNDSTVRTAAVIVRLQHADVTKRFQLHGILHNHELVSGKWEDLIFIKQVDIHADMNFVAYTFFYNSLN